jgi:hypothetical protein
VLEVNDIKKIDGMYVPQEAVRRFNKKVIDHVLSNKSRPPADMTMQNELSQVQADQNGQGATRFFKPSDISSKMWKDIFKDLEWEVEVNISIDPNGSSEASDKGAIMQTLNSTLQLIMNPGYASNPQAQMVVQEILRQTGRYSPLQLSSTPPPQPVPPPSAPIPSPMNPPPRSMAATGQGGAK